MAKLIYELNQSGKFSAFYFDRGFIFAQLILAWIKIQCINKDH